MKSYLLFIIHYFLLILPLFFGIVESFRELRIEESGTHRTQSFGKNVLKFKNFVSIVCFNSGLCSHIVHIKKKDSTQNSLNMNRFNWTSLIENMEVHLNVYGLCMCIVLYREIWPELQVTRVRIWYKYPIYRRDWKSKLRRIQSIWWVHDIWQWLQQKVSVQSVIQSIQKRVLCEWPFVLQRSNLAIALWPIIVYRRIFSQWFER